MAGQDDDGIQREVLAAMGLPCDFHVPAPRLERSSSLDVELSDVLLGAAPREAKTLFHMLKSESIGLNDAQRLGVALTSSHSTEDFVRAINHELHTSSHPRSFVPTPRVSFDVVLSPSPHKYCAMRAAYAHALASGLPEENRDAASAKDKDMVDGATQTDPAPMSWACRLWAAVRNRKHAGK